MHIHHARCAVNTNVISDVWKAYLHLGEAGFRHEVVNHSLEFVDQDTGAHTQTVEGAWGMCKLEINTHKGIQKEQLPTFLHRWCFRRNFCTKKNIESHYEIITKAIATYWNK